MGELGRFESYEVVRREDGSALELGRGAMGITYQARDSRNGEIVALKVINAARLESEIFRRRFAREARAAAAIQHPNVARVFHQGEQEGGCFYVMEFIDGETLLDALRRDGALPTARALEIARQVAAALVAAAEKGLVHRDIKPSNVMLVRGTGTVKLIDFGLAKHAADRTPASEDASTLTQAGFLGTPHFASPEQLEERALDARTDIYSLGATLYYALAGRTPFTGSLAQVMSQHLHETPSWEGLADQPAAAVALVGRMMAKNPDARPATAAILLEEIEACIASVAAARAGSPGGAPVLDGEGETVTEAEEEAEIPPALVPGATLAGRFELLEDHQPGEFGRTFRARNLETGGIVAVLFLDRRLLPTSEAYTRLENEVNALQGVRHPTVIPVHSIEWCAPHCWISREWVEGPSLLDAMHDGLPLAEALRLLTALAAGLDAVQRTGGPCPALAAQWITLAPDPVSGERRPKFNALNFSHFVPRTPSEPHFLRRAAADYVCTLAALAYEMFGGSLAGNSDLAFVPLRSFSAEANAILRRALHPAHGFPAPGIFVAALATAAGSDPTIPA